MPLMRSNGGGHLEERASEESGNESEKHFAAVDEALTLTQEQRDAQLATFTSLSSNTLKRSRTSFAEDHKSSPSLVALGNGKRVYSPTPSRPSLAMYIQPAWMGHSDEKRRQFYDLASSEIVSAVDLPTATSTLSFSWKALT